MFRVPHYSVVLAVATVVVYLYTCTKKYGEASSCQTSGVHACSRYRRAATESYTVRLGRPKETRVGSTSQYFLLFGRHPRFLFSKQNFELPSDIRSTDENNGAIPTYSSSTSFHFIPLLVL